MRTASVLHLCLGLVFLAAAAGDRWQMLQPSIGVSAMHMQLLFNDRVVIFDRTDFGTSNISLPAGKCRRDRAELAVKDDCTAHSVEYDIAANAVRPLNVLTDTWCSSGTVDPTGRLIQTGGFNDGDDVIRTFRPCDDGLCDWEETSKALAVRRWYASNQILPDGRAIIVGGRGQYNYEFYPKNDRDLAGAIPLKFLADTRDPEENNLYPFLHLCTDGNVYIFANNRAILFDYSRNAVLKTFPPMPGGDPRNYPSTGSSVLLPIKAYAPETEVLVCGGAPAGSFYKARRGSFLPALNTCGRIKISEESPKWSVETMPTARTMGDMVLLPSGDDVLIINGVAAGTAGWEYGREPVLTPVTYRHFNPLGTRFTVQTAAARPRLYHSSAVLLRDGRVLVGGSNPHVGYNFTGVEYPTDLSLEAYSPEYLFSEYSSRRPRIATQGPVYANYGKLLKLRFTAEELAGKVAVTMVAPAFATHSFSMNQRVVFLDSARPKADGGSPGSYEIRAVAPTSRAVAPPGYYMGFVVNKGIPSEGIWLHLS